MSGPAKVAAGQGESPRIVKAIGELSSLLVPGETLEAHAIQRRLFALVRRRAVVGATSGRLIGMTRGLIGGFHPRDVRWQDLKDVRLDVGIFGADLILTAYTSPDLAVSGQTISLVFDGLRKDEAQRVYRIAQAQEQAWREKRRMRELEELRAKSGGINLSGAPGGGGLGSAGADEEPVSRLQRAKEMLQKGLISDSEYESLKAKIVGTM